MYELRITRATPNNYELKVGDLTIPSNGGMEVRYHTAAGLVSHMSPQPLLRSFIGTDSVASTCRLGTTRLGGLLWKVPSSETTRFFSDFLRSGFV